MTIPVFVGYTNDEITKIIKRQKNWKKELRELWENHGGFKTELGGIVFDGGYTILFLKGFEDVWEDYETLMHECFHIVMKMAQARLLINHTTNTIEEEALAYQQEYLFRSIRRKLQDAFKIKR